MKNQTASLYTHDLKKSFLQGKKDLPVLNGITVDLQQGKTYAITGVSGSGKSTFMHLLAGLDTPSAGTINYGGQNLAALAADARMQFLNKEIGLVFQDPYLIRELSILENCMIKGLIAGNSFQAEISRAMELLETVGLADKAYCQPGALSGGQQQRVAIVRAIFNRPIFLLADEPTGSLDEAMGNDIVNLLLQCQKEWDMGLIVSSHDPIVFKRMEVIYRLHNGLLETVSLKESV